MSFHPHKVCRSILLATATVFFATAAQSAASTVEIRIGGTGNAIGTMQLLANAYASTNPAAKVTVLKSIGTSGAIKAVSRHAIAIGLASRTVTPEEAAAGLVAIEYARCPTVFAVQARNHVTGLTTEQITAILRGDMSVWPDGTPIRPVLRQPDDDNTRQIRLLSPGMAAAIDVADRRPGAIVAATDQEAADKLENIPGSIGVTTTALIRSEKRRLRELPLNGVEPDIESARSGRYPLVKRFYFIIQKAHATEVADFIRFAGSAAGQRVLLETGHLTP